jgi:putative nucleotidyltransferase with HDIG domain
MPRRESHGENGFQARLLVVEDDTAVREFCVRLLRLIGYQVAWAENGRQALDTLNRESFDLVLTDLAMPEMDGITLLQQIRTQHPTTDIIMITAYGTIETAKRAIKLGAFDFMMKPINTEDLERSVRQCLEYRHLQQDRQRLTEMVMLLQLSRTITGTLDTDTQVREISKLIWDRFAPNVLSLSLLDPDHDELVLLVGEGLPSPVALGTRQSIGALRGDQWLRESHYRLLCSAARSDARLEACVVLRTNDRPVGVLHLCREDGRAEFDSDDRQLLTIFASQVAAALENGRLYQALKAQNVQIITALAAAIDARDPYTRGHSEQVARYAVSLAEAIDYTSEQIEQVRYAALLHDIGKIGIRDSILLKPGPLTDAEYASMKEHPLIGAEIVQGISALHELIPSIEQHHERIDGKGYPYGLIGDAIHPMARILAIADAFDAMTSQRAYRHGMDRERAIGELLTGRGRQWDERLVDAFVAVLRREGEALMEVKDRPAQRALVK